MFWRLSRKVQKICQTKAGLPNPIPTAIYLDKTPFTNNDSIMGVILVNLLDGSQTLLASLRKSELCCCGCKGWCTMHGVWQLLEWCYNAGKIGKHPSKRHDGSDFGPNDVIRAGKSGTACDFFILQFLQGDWAEVVSSIGLPSW
eukprot:12103616-Karenia_brevis.AAC.1